AAAVTLFFALMAGWVPSVARAAVMALIGLAAPLLRRGRDAHAALAVAALALLVSQPLLLFDAGFQLSFAATWGLLYIAPVLALHLSVLPRSLRSLFAMTVAAQIAVGPLLAYHFLQISVVGLAANLIVIPLVALLVPAGFAVAVVGAVIPTLGVSLAPVLGPPADAVRWTAAVFARRLVPALRRLHLRTIDIMLLSHPHEDHVGGLIAALQNFPVRLVLDSGFEHPAPSYPRFLRLVEAQQIPYRLARRGQRLDLGDGAAAAVL